MKSACKMASPFQELKIYKHNLTPSTVCCVQTNFQLQKSVNNDNNFLKTRERGKKNFQEGLVNKETLKMKMF